MNAAHRFCSLWFAIAVRVSGRNTAAKRKPEYLYSPIISFSQSSKDSLKTGKASGTDAGEMHLHLALILGPSTV